MESVEKHRSSTYEEIPAHFRAVKEMIAIKGDPNKWMYAL